MDLIQRCIDALPTAQRAVFCFKEIEDKKTSEICKIMDVTVSHLGVLFYRARNELRECIEMKASEA